LDRNILIKKYFEQHSLVESNINSFNTFVEKGLQSIIEELGEIIPTIIPPNVKDFKIKFDKLWVKKPQVTEADGSKRDIYPIEARLRKITYSAPIYLEVSVYIDGIQRENFVANIGKLPIMVKSKYCHLHNLKRADLIKYGEDPGDPGGYFILNGNERVLITVEDLASNRFFIEKTSVGPSEYVGKIFSERYAYRIPHFIEQMKDGIMYLTFTRFRRISIISIIKALGLVSDQKIIQTISEDEVFDDVLINLLSSEGLKTEEDALEEVGKKIGINQPKDIKLEKTRENLDRYLLPHLGIESKDRLVKAQNLCKMIKKFLITSREGLVVDKDHYRNKRLKLSGDLLIELFRVNMRALVNDLLYNFQRLVKRGKFTSTKIIIRDKLLTQRIKSAMATGTWIGGRKGVSQNIDRTNFLASLSHLQRIVSLLSSSQENFNARALHSTHWGRLCPIETPEGTSIGLRKNLAVLCNITQDTIPSEKVKKILEDIGLKTKND